MELIVDVGGITAIVVACAEDDADGGTVATVAS